MSRILPILFNTNMVRAILDGRKTATRRICKEGNDFTVPDMSFYDADKRTYAVHNYTNKDHTDKLSLVERRCPICPSDILYVRETWVQSTDLFGEFPEYIYRADSVMDGTIWHPSIHMPKRAARIWLKVTDVRVERLQDITEVQAEAEGAIDNRGFIHSPENEYENIHTAREHFVQIWNSTLKKSDLDIYGWDANPWVWVIEFERCERPE